MNQPYEVIVIGGGHNGLVNAAYLARAGKKVLVLGSQGEAGTTGDKVVPTTLASRFEKVGGDAAARASRRRERRGSAK